MRAEPELFRADHLVVVCKELLRVTKLHDQISDAATQGALTTAATCARSLAATASCQVAEKRAVGLVFTEEHVRSLIDVLRRTQTRVTPLPLISHPTSRMKNATYVRSCP